MARCGGVAPTAKRRRSSAPVTLRSSSTDRRRSGASLLGSSDDDDDDMITNDDVSMDGIDNTTGAPTTAPSSPHSLVETGDIRLRRRAAALVDKPLIWAQCDACGKWRSLPLCRSETELPKAWDCTLNPDRNMARCSAPEEPFGPGSSEYDESEVPFRYGVDTLFLVFQHLALRELCTVHCVSKAWKRVAAHPILWKLIRFSHDTPVRLWPSLIARMAINGTTAWDLRNVALHLGTLSPSGLSALKHMWLPVATPYEAVPAFTSGTPSLESLLVDDFDPTAGRLDFGHLGTLESLRTLQIRSTHGIKLPAFSFAGGTDALASLVNLRVLELTGLRGASAADFNFIGSLQHLQSLALGECSLWDSSVYRALGGLSKLTRLRLEMVTNDPTQPELTECLECLAFLERLDLILVEPPADFGRVLAKLDRLRTLVIVPYAGEISRVREVQKRCIDAVLGTPQLTDLRMAFVDGSGVGPNSVTVAYGHDDLTRSALRHMLVKSLSRASITLCIQPKTTPAFSQADFMRGCIVGLPFSN